MFAMKVVHTAQNMFMVQLATSLAVLTLSSCSKGKRHKATLLIVSTPTASNDVKPGLALSNTQSMRIVLVAVRGAALVVVVLRPETRVDEHRTGSVVTVLALVFRQRGRKLR